MWPFQTTFTMTTRQRANFLVCGALLAAAAHGQASTQADPPVDEFHRGVQAFNAGQLADAKRIWEALLTLFPNRPELLNNLAVLSLENGDPQSASFLLKQAVQQSPAYASIDANWKKLSKARDPKPDLALVQAWPQPGIRVSVIPARTFWPLASLEAEIEDLEADEDFLSADASVNVAREPPEAEAKPSTGMPDTALKLALEQWMSHWISRDVVAYLRWYSADFTPAFGASRSAWETQRRTRLTNARRIALQMQAVRTEPGPSPNTQWLHMVQHYQSATYSDVTEKSMLWVQTPDGWRILRESATPYRRPKE